RQLLATLADALEVRVGDLHLVHDPVFARKSHHQSMSGAAKMTLAQGRCSEALVLLCIFLVADADVLAIEEPDDCGKNCLAGQVAALEVVFDPPPQPLERLPELEEPL